MATAAWAVMVAPFVLLLVPFYGGLLSGGGLMGMGHVGMVLAMLALVVVRARDYAQPPGWRLTATRRVTTPPSTAMDESPLTSGSAGGPDRPGRGGAGGPRG